MMDTNGKPRVQRALALTDEGYRSLKGAVAACTLTNLVLMVPFTITVMVFGTVLMRLTGQDVDWQALWGLFAAGVVGLVAVFLCARNDYRRTYVTAYRETEATRMGLAEHLRRLPMSFFNQRDLSELTENLMGDVSSRESLMSSTVPQLVASCVSTAVVCVMLAFFEWRLALGVFATLPAALLIVLAARGRERRLFERQTEARLAASAQLMDYVEGMRDIRACRQVGAQSAPMRAALRALRDIAMKVELAVDVCVSAATTVLQAGVGITVFSGCALLAGGEVDFLTLLMFLLIASRVYGPITSILSQLPNLLQLSGRTARLRALADEPVAAGTGDASGLGVKPIDLRDVRFSYADGDDEVLRGISFRMEPGTVTALVGHSGSGKSTVAKLVARFYAPSSGAIRAGGVDLAGLDEESWLRNVSVVFQDVTLFDDTVMENIRMGRLGATDEEVRAAARAAHCEEFIERLPEGWATRLGENGARLSGGERQRISIARALLKDAPVVLLDEATSSLDPENETLVQDAVGRLCAGKTVLVIAHRLRTVAGADRIVVLDRGCVAEQGTHAELMAAGGLYAHLVRIQQESLGWTVARP
ncbi:ABC transporter ATP-binding protein [Collinsella ihumii]|uniref:ABC transporter ATP-binding protein n=1 Tax=Collinsella ihumii TaxID=1720204 RepID=A0ABT7XBL1_9ACTN|nr:ABC transporter ATP-binding protein [Collinsella ihumii]MDN0062791.1 ABC transporter ATP-binding protein [Collinsella ihumii]